MKKVVPRKFAEEKNNDGLTPGDLFIKEHEELKKKGETWVKDNASSCMIVATLITTVVFGAAITVPGGYKEGIVSRDECFAQLTRAALKQLCRMLLSKPRASRTREERAIEPKKKLVLHKERLQCLL